MRFLVLMAEEGTFDKWEQADDALRRRVMADFDAFGEAVRTRGALVAGEALDRPEAARTVRPGPGEPGTGASGPGQGGTGQAGTGRPVTDGPFAETVEQLGGFYLIDVPDLATAVELATLLPREYTVEVRPTVEVDV